MQYLRHHGSFEDVPHAFIIASVKLAYPHLADVLDAGRWITRD